MLLLWLLRLLFENPIYFLIALLLLIVPLLISITIHEWSHGMTAYLFGDPTPKEQKRLSFNPLRHLDPLGTLMLFIIGIGWAKPIEIDPRNIPGRTKQMLVALSGPASNMLMAVLFSFILYITTQFIANEGGFTALIIQLLRLIIQINIILAIFNMLPIPPLDGSNVLKWLLPEPIATAYMRLAPFGMIILLLLLFTVGFRFIFDASRTVQIFIYQIIDYILGPLF